MYVFIAVFYLLETISHVILIDSISSWQQWHLVQSRNYSSYPPCYGGTV